MGPTLVVNPGSSSKKYALYHEGDLLTETRFEDTETGFETCSSMAGTQQVCQSVSKSDFEESLPKVAMEARAYVKGRRLPSIDVVVVRVVAPGEFFQSHRELDAEYIKKLQACQASAPLHVPVILREVKAIKAEFPEAKIIAASDSAFHSTLPACAREYSIKRSDAADLGLYRYGYHGLSVSSVVRRIHAHIGQDPKRMIVCHVGNGVSVTGVKDGKSVDTTMGFAPTSGLPMGSRAGDIEPGALLELMRARNYKPAEADIYLNTNGGLKGLSGDSDIRQLLARRGQNDETATLALDSFAYHIQKAIAGMAVSLEGLDVLVLTATAMVRSSELRQLVTDKLAHLGVKVGPERNHMLVGKDGIISVRNSAVKVVVMRTDEMTEMAHVAAELERKKQKGIQ